jgi:Asp-tRNA(Asn)/Glu-tRNA(Gln) amidotransferase A subunit family amidase
MPAVHLIRRCPACATIAAVATGPSASPDTAATTAALVRRGELSAAESAAAAIERAEATHARLNAVAVAHYEQAVAAAGRLAGSALPLAGVPVSVKESLDLAGTPSSGGVEALANARAAEDGRIVRALRAAGAVPVAKGNLAQLLWFAETENPVYGRTSSPHAAGRSPGGSSGGDAALVAAGVVPVAIGTDIGGSVRQPAHCCGVFALKPTAGRLSLAGSLDERLFAGFPWVANQPGIFARDPADLELVLAVLDAGAAAGPEPPPRARAGPVAGLRVGVVETNGVVDPSPPVRRAVEIAAGAAAHGGAHLVPFTPPAAAHALALFDEVFVSDAGAAIAGTLAGTTAHLRVAAALAAARRGHPEARPGTLARRIAAYRRSFADALDAARLDAVISPVYPVTAVRHGTSQEHVRGQSYASIWNLVGYPAGVAPIAAAAASQLPVGAQVAARPWREDVVLGLLAAMSAEKPPFRHITDR